MTSPKFKRPAAALRKALSAVVRVGDGRGFVVDGKMGRLVITAAHCLPFFPPCATASFPHERIYKSLLGRLGEEAPTIWAECLFIDPIADIAVLGMPDDQAVTKEAIDYETMIASTGALSISNEVWDEGRGWMLALDLRWYECSATSVRGGPLWMDAKQQTQGGMSGSPILAVDARRAIGVVCTGGDEYDNTSGPNPWISRSFPGWLLDDIGLIHQTKGRKERG